MATNAEEIKIDLLITLEKQQLKLNYNGMIIDVLTLVYIYE
jgi:hypothetical protein